MPVKDEVSSAVDRLSSTLSAVGRFLHLHPELAYEERESARYLTSLLRAHHFEVIEGVGGLPTAFIATAGVDHPSATVAFLAEYDALPVLGHACGHNLIAASSVGAALALQPFLSAIGGRLQVVGCPAEEKGGGKIALVKAGLFADVDAALLVHPSNRTEIFKSALAMRALRVEFFGKASHAAAAPYLGINALDALVLAFTNLNALRQQLRDDARIHGIITDGGRAPNIIPDHSAARFCIRSLDLDYLGDLYGRVVGCFEGAAKATGATVTIDDEGEMYHPMRCNRALGALFRANLEALGERIEQTPEDQELGSTDVGNVSQVVPTIHPTIALTDQLDVVCHSAAFAEAAGGSAGDRTILLAGKALAMTAVDLFTDSTARRYIQEEFGARHARRSGPDQPAATVRVI
ncbi:peptidase M20 domain-containing protein 2 (Aminoacylase 1-like protein 2) [Candidatus Methylomirabilis lanthanidiphila]|uniref:Peptidase M20 domain-containing protein 2 n=1 Tax=Candidatus Methylomirabilis lanthanidiphila TaxID=2211376 RepID=A0A564ZG72_9BACT|nr:M20 family metallopeptidase [Candidatus Methylomirabilis lanthanidiphila]VUZ84319.1 peptidase M20 domain-containing protein 2 (Aminoacylase 1-like protein 2) [Candidatus Methylomirabilis lanthanidiphila]